MIRRREETRQRLRDGIDSRGRNLIVCEPKACLRIDDRAAEGREIPAPFSERRHRRVRIVWIARVIACVVQKEEGARAVDGLADHERAANGRAESLLQVLRLRRRLTVQRVRRGVE